MLIRLVFSIIFEEVDVTEGNDNQGNNAQPPALITFLGDRSSGYEYALDYDGLKDFIGESGETLPVRCKAPETLLRNCYSIPSDVWAFAIFVYETLTLGCRPYKDIQRDEHVVDYVRRITVSFCIPNLLRIR